MSTKRKFHKYSAILSLLATLYLVVGSQIIHPRFHAHTLISETGHGLTSFTEDHTTCHSDHEHIQHYSSVSIAQHELAKENCPVCAILACCWFAPVSANTLVFHLDSSELTETLYAANSGFLQPSVYRIRGPPIANC